MPKKRVVRIEEEDGEAIDALRDRAKELSGADVSFAAMTRTVVKNGIEKVAEKQKRSAK